MNKLGPSSVHFKAPNVTRTNIRANDLINQVACQYSLIKKNLDEAQTVDLTCCIGGNHFQVARLSPYSEEYVHIVTAENDGGFHSIFCPVEQLAFFISISKRQDDKPPREIGFHTIAAPMKKSQIAS